MKKKFFYSHIIETSSVSLLLADMDVTQTERKHLLTLAEAKLHHTIIDMVLSELSQEDKKVFLLQLHSNHHEKIWNMLQKKITAIEDKITKAADDLKRQMHADILEAKKHS